MSGELPEQFDLPQEIVSLELSTAPLQLLFYGRPQFAFELEIRAVDLNGNLGLPTIVYVTNDGE